MTKVLLVDDDDRQRKLSCVLLEDAGYSVEHAASALAALRMAGTNRPDVILSDVMMEEIDGFGLCRRLQDDTQLAGVPIVLVSAHYDDHAARELAKTLGASALINRTPDFSAELAAIATCTTTSDRTRGRQKRESYEAHLATNANQIMKLLEQAQRAEVRWRTLFEHAQDTLTVLTVSGVIIEANQRWFDVLGVPAGDLIGRHIRDLTPAGFEASNLAYFRELVERGTQQVVIPLRHANGSTVFMEFASNVIDVDGAPHVLSVGRDVTQKLEAEARAAAAESERRRLEERLEHAQRIETIGQLAGGIAHDFNNVLSAILSCAELLLDDLDEVDPRRTDATEIREAARRGAALTERLLAFSRRQVVARSEVDVSGIVQSASTMLRRLIGGGIDLRVEQTGPANVYGDPLQLEQVVVNLAINARDAMPKGGKLVIATDQVAIAEGDKLPAGEYVVLTVSDSGTGMSEDTRSHLFEPFFTTKGPGHGTGLGLSTAHRIVEQLGGRIVVESELGRGTTMKVYLPRHRARSAA